MEQDYDKHLCLKCGRIIIGLDNYVSHRKQQCCTDQTESPFLSDSSDVLTSVETAKELEPPFTTSDVYKPSADDFFLSLNLQNIANVGCSSQRTLSSGTENLCSKLGFPTLENDLDSAFVDDKEFLPENVISGNAGMSMGNLTEGNQNHECQVTFSDAVDLPNEVFTEKPRVEAFSLQTEKIIAKKEASRLKLIKKIAKKSNYNLTVSRTSQRQAEKESSDTLCCKYAEEELLCEFCGFKCVFPSTFLNHLLICNVNYRDKNSWSAEMFKYEHIFTENAQFNCKSCVFSCNDASSFLEHLKDKIHSQKIVKLKHSLLCLPCDVEFFGCDGLLNHFSKYHMSSDFSHPIVINEKTKHLHCCFCFKILKKCDSLLLSITAQLNLHVEDIKFIRNMMKIIPQCSYGIKKPLLSSYTKLFKLLSNKTSSEFKLIDYSVDEDKNKKIVKSLKSSTKKLKSLKNSVKELLNSSGLKKNDSNCSISSVNNRFFCFVCKTKHSNVTAFKDHLQLHVNNSEQFSNLKEVYLCESCGYVSKTYHQLTKHKRSHTGEKPFKCKVCNTSFAMCSQLLRHTRLHTGAKPYKCPYCSYVCNTQENLRKHILKTKKHAGKKMYPCKHCDFECNDFSNYKNHLLCKHSETFPDNKCVNSSAVAGLYVTI